MLEIMCVEIVYTNPHIHLNLSAFRRVYVLVPYVVIILFTLSARLVVIIADGEGM